MNEDITEKRVKDLEDNIHQDLDLLKEYEDELRYETDPRHKGKYRREIERQHESLTHNQKEYDKLRRQMTPEELQKVTDLLQQKDAKLDEIWKLLPPIWNISQHRNPNFTGRKGILKALRLALISGEPAAWKQAITSMGGVGKTQLTVEYIYRHKADYRVIWWIRSEEPATMAADYASLAVDLNLPEKESTDQTEIVKAVKRWLEHNVSWLLIFDNAQDPGEIRNYLPQGGAGHVIITSRNPYWRPASGAGAGRCIYRNDWHLANRVPGTIPITAKGTLGGRVPSAGLSRFGGYHMVPCYGAGQSGIPGCRRSVEPLRLFSIGRHLLRAFEWGSRTSP
jgi:3-methyladenine DNA glycosylase/8-oxoguanine DNA glycosylase